MHTPTVHKKHTCAKCGRKRNETEMILWGHTFIGQHWICDPTNQPDPTDWRVQYGRLKLCKPIDGSLYKKIVSWAIDMIALFTTHIEPQDAAAVWVRANEGLSPAARLNAERADLVPAAGTAGEGTAAAIVKKAKGVGKKRSRTAAGVRIRRKGSAAKSSTGSALRRSGKGKRGRVSLATQKVRPGRKATAGRPVKVKPGRRNSGAKVKPGRKR